MPEAMVVPPSFAGERVDRAIALLTGWSRREVRDLVRGDAVLVEGQPVTAGHRLSGGEVLELLAEPPPDEPPSADPVPLDVRHVDDDVIVLDKPAGLVVHPGAGHEHGTLVHGVLDRFPEVAGVGDPNRPGIVHRLDRDTSGLLVVARSAAAYDELVHALAARAVERRYVALVWGVPASPRGIIDAPIGRAPRRRTRMAVRESGRDARTAYEVREVLGRGRGVALLDCALETGRTHQIRVHLSAIAHPIVGDAAYGGVRPGIDLDRPFLHAAVVSFRHPVTRAAVHVEAPLPSELAIVLEDLRRGAPPDGAGEAGWDSGTAGEGTSRG
jgi:23S rRNA pseudouridine1911/1915/1917 synthase